MALPAVKRSSPFAYADAAAGSRLMPDRKYVVRRLPTWRTDTQPRGDAAEIFAPFVDCAAYQKVRDAPGRSTKAVHPANRHTAIWCSVAGPVRAILRLAICRHPLERQRERRIFA